MSDRPQGEGWWLASDGKWYPPESHPAPPAPPAPPWATAPQSRLSPGLNTTVRVFFYLSAGLAGLVVVALANAIPKMNDYWFAPIGSDADEWEAWDLASDLWTGAAGFLGLAGLVLFILLLVWGSQAYRSLGRSGAEGRSWSRGGRWAAGSSRWPAPSSRLVLSESRAHRPPRQRAAAGGGALAAPAAHRDRPGVVDPARRRRLRRRRRHRGDRSRHPGGGRWGRRRHHHHRRRPVPQRPGGGGRPAIALAGIAQLLGAAYFRAMGERLLR